MAPKPSKARHDAVIFEFTDLANQTPAERMRSQILERLGLTEDDLKRQLTGDDGKDEPSADTLVSA